MDLLSKAIIIATKGHDGQVDKGGKPYILHPLRLMMKFKSADLKIVAVLHDVLEDTEITAEDLLNEGFGDDIIKAVQCLTRQKGEDYMTFIGRCKNNRMARLVKMADLEDNSDLSRIPKPTQRDRDRILKYRKALNMLF